VYIIRGAEVKKVKVHLEIMHLDLVCSTMLSLKQIGTSSFVISNTNIGKIFDIEEVEINDGETSLQPAARFVISHHHSEVFMLSEL
jgi:hypothetical protein